MLISQLGAGRLLMIGAAGAISLGLLAWMILGMSNPPMALLFSGLDARDSSKIIERLRQDGVKYESQGGGSIIYVEEDEALRLRMRFASEGFGTGSVVGWELFDDQSALGSTSFVQNINHLRAMEGELARTIASIDSVAAARVHLNIPKREIFSKEAQHASASVVLKTKHGRLEGSTVQAIQQLTASAVPGLAPKHISIVDDRGNLLAGGNRNGDENGSTHSIEERTLAFEERMRQQVYEMIAGIVGPGRARVQVAAEVDFNRVVEESEIFDPDGQVVRRTDSYERSAAAVDREEQNSVSVGNQLPDAGLPIEGEDEPSSSNNENELKETVSYEISKTKRTEVSEAGGVKRLSVAVVVDGTYAENADGERQYSARNQDELDQIKRLVERTIGFDEERGDKIEVINMQFATFETPDFVEEKKGLFSFSQSQIFQIAQTAVMGIVVLIVGLFVIKPIISTLAKPAAAATGSAEGVPAIAGAAPGAAQPQLEGAAAQAALPPPQAGGGAPGLPAPDPNSIASQIDVAQVDGKVQESSIRKIGEIVTSHPEESVSILRNWLHESE